MSLNKIKKALELHLSTIAPALSTAYEGVSFTPVVGTPYQRVILVPRKPKNTTMGDDHYREVGEFQIFLCYPTNQGTGNALARADVIRSHFQRGTSLIEDDIVVQINYTPQIGGSSIAGDRLVVPVIIPYSVEIFNV